MANARTWHMIGMYEWNSLCNIVQTYHVDHVKVDKVKYFKRFIKWDRAQEVAIKIFTHVNYGRFF